MSSPKYFLLAFQGNDGNKIVLDFESEHYLSGKLAAANNLGIWVRRLTAAELETEEFKEAQLFDMRHHVTSKIFHLEQWQNYLLNEGQEPSLAKFR